MFFGAGVKSHYCERIASLGCLQKTGLVCEQAKAQVLAEEERALAELRSQLTERERKWHETAAEHASTVATAQVSFITSSLLGLSICTCMQTHSQDGKPFSCKSVQMRWRAGSLLGVPTLVK